MKTITTKAWQLLLCLIGSLPLATTAQLTINNAEGFNVGDVLRFVECNSSGVQPGAGGANVNWDFSNLVPTGDTLTEWMVAPSTTPYAAEYPTANLVEKYSDGRYIYIDKTPTHSYLVGYKDPAGGITIKYPDAALIGKRPISYGEVIIDSLTADMQTGVALHGAGVITLTADAYGTLTLPNGTYNDVLRVHLSQVEVDTVVGFGTTTTYVETYVWFDNAHASALLKIDSTFNTSGFTSKNVEYLADEITGVKHPALHLKNYSATLQDNLLTIFGDVSGCNIALYDAIGRPVTTEASQTEGRIARISVDNLSSGVFTVVLKRNSQLVGLTRVAKVE